MKKLLYFAAVALFLSCDELSNTNKPIRYYLDKDSLIYHKGDTLTLNNGNRYLKVYGVTGCKYGCPVLIELK